MGIHIYVLASVAWIISQAASEGFAVFRPQLAFQPTPSTAAPPARPPPTSNFVILNAGPEASRAHVAKPGSQVAKLVNAVGGMLQPQRAGQPRGPEGAPSGSESATESGTLDETGAIGATAEPEWASRREKSKALNRTGKQDAQQSSREDVGHRLFSAGHQGD